tara:strand:- start:1476 stop:1673 length:198 start_codon:yes stop_codon:yes gene_type:complete
MGRDKYNIPKNSKEACLCRDGSYSKKCCGKDYYSQGIGNVTRTLFFLYTEEGEKFIQENNSKLYQ